jgi:hypothetical protein
LTGSPRCGARAHRPCQTPLRQDRPDRGFAYLAARRTEASGGTIGGDFGLRGLAGALDLPRTAV